MLTIKERIEIRNRNKGNEDVNILLRECDEILCELNKSRELVDIISHLNKPMVDRAKEIQESNNKWLDPSSQDKKDSDQRSGS